LLKLCAYFLTENGQNTVTTLSEVVLARWCVTTEAAEEKCNQWVEAVDNVKKLGQMANNVRSAYVNPQKQTDFSSMPQLSCVRAQNVYV